jgi:hypothetical protein
MSFKTISRLFLTVSFLFGAAVAQAQQRPLLTEDPRLLPEGILLTEVGFGYQHRARFPVSGLTGDLYSFMDDGLHFGLGDRAEFQMTGVIHNYLRLEGGAGRRNDWGDLALSTKIKIVNEGHKRPIISFRPTVVLPNSSQTKGIGTDGTHFFGSLLLGKSVGSAFVFGNVGLGILDDAVRPAAQQDLLTYGFAAAVPAGSRVTVLAEWNGRYNQVSNPTPGGESRSQARLGLQLKTGGLRWDVAATAGTSYWEHKAGFVAGVSKEFLLWR